MRPRGGFDPCRVTAFQHVVLYLLHAEPVSGIELSNALDEELAAEVSDSRIYHNLAELVEEGLVYRSPADGRENRYGLTEAGEEWLRERREWEYGLTARSW